LWTAYGVAVGAGYWVLLYLFDPTDVIGLVFFGLALPAFFGFHTWVATYYHYRDPDWGWSMRFITFSPVMMAAVAPVAFLVCAAVVVGWPVAVFVVLTMRWKFRARMRAKGRWLSTSELRRELEAGRGTLIVEIGETGHTWWTGDDLRSLGEPPGDGDLQAIRGGEAHPFNDRVLCEYLDLDAGKALLTSHPPRRLLSAVPFVWAARPLHD